MVPRRPMGQAVLMSASSPPFFPPRFVVIDAVQRALVEDLTPLGDLTSSLLPPEQTAEAVFMPREDGVLAGRACVTEAFHQVDPEVRLEWYGADGDPLTAG